MVNSGANARDEAEVFNCITTDQGPANVHTLIGKVIKFQDYKSIDIKNIRSFNTFCFETEGIRAWKQGLIGEGILTRLQDKPRADRISTFEHKIVHAAESKKTTNNYQKPGLETDLPGEIHDSDDHVEDENLGEDSKSDSESSKNLYFCSNPRCQLTFRYYASWQKHEQGDNCAIKLRCYSQIDHVTYRWVSRYSASKIEKANLEFTQRVRRHIMTPVGFEMKVSPYPDSIPKIESKLKNVFNKGWVLCEEADTSDDCQNCSEEEKADQKVFVREQFDYGKNPANKKISPFEAMTKMRWAKKPNGQRRFTRKGWLKQSQIRSMYGRFAAETKKKTQNVTEDEIEDAALQNDLEVKTDVVKVMAQSMTHTVPLTDQECPKMVSVILLNNI